MTRKPLPTHGQFYHVADPSYTAGADLMCYDLLVDAGIAPAWKWEEQNEGLDTDVVCLFESLDDAKEFQSDFQPDGIVLSVFIPEDAAGEVRFTRVREGYTAIRNRIPAEFISVV